MAIRDFKENFEAIRHSNGIAFEKKKILLKNLLYEINYQYAEHKETEEACIVEQAEHLRLKIESYLRNPY